MARGASRCQRAPPTVRHGRADFELALAYLPASSSEAATDDEGEGMDEADVAGGAGSKRTDLVDLKKGSALRRAEVWTMLCTLSDRDLVLLENLSRPLVACDLCTIEPVLRVGPLFAWRTNARVFYQVAQTQRTELAVLRGTESSKTQTSRPLRSKTLIIPKRDH